MFRCFILRNISLKQQKRLPHCRVVDVDQLAFQREHNRYKHFAVPNTELRKTEFVRIIDVCEVFNFRLSQ